MADSQVLVLDAEPPVMTFSSWSLFPFTCLAQFGIKSELSSVPVVCADDSMSVIWLKNAPRSSEKNVYRIEAGALCPTQSIFPTDDDMELFMPDVMQILGDAILHEVGDELQIPGASLYIVERMKIIQGAVRGYSQVRFIMEIAVDTS